MDIEARIKAALARPMTHLVVTTYASGKLAYHETRGANEAETWAHLERQKLGRDLINRESGATVRVVDVAITDKATLAAQYVETIGYDPFEDSSDAITLSEVHEILTEVRALEAESAK